MGPQTRKPRQKSESGYIYCASRFQVLKVELSAHFHCERQVKWQQQILFICGHHPVDFLWLLQYSTDNTPGDYAVPGVKLRKKSRYCAVSPEELEGSHNTAALLQWPDRWQSKSFHADFVNIRGVMFKFVICSWSRLRVLGPANLRGSSGIDPGTRKVANENEELASYCKWKSDSVGFLKPLAFH